MVIKIEVSDLELFSKALNNALVAYGDIVYSIGMGLDPQISSSKFSKLKAPPIEELQARVNELIDVYNQVVEKEKEINEDQKNTIIKDE